MPIAGLLDKQDGDKNVWKLKGTMACVVQAINGMKKYTLIQTETISTLGKIFSGFENPLKKLFGNVSFKNCRKSIAQKGYSIKKFPLKK